MEARDGSFGFDFEGFYKGIDAPHALMMRLDDGRMSRTTFDPETTNPIEMQRAGWQAILENFATYVTRTQAST
jgi:hypothetical protein